MRAISWYVTFCRQYNMYDIIVSYCPTLLMLKNCGLLSLTPATLRKYECRVLATIAEKLATVGSTKYKCNAQYSSCSKIKILLYQVPETVNLEEVIIIVTFLSVTHHYQDQQRGIALDPSFCRLAHPGKILKKPLEI